MFVFVNAKSRFKCVFNFPDQHKPDHDRVAQFVVYFDGFAVKVTGAQRNLSFVEERVYPEEPVFFNGSL
jgi:hypothetical protein